MKIRLPDRVAEELAVRIRAMGADHPGDPFKVLLDELDRKSPPSTAKVRCPYCRTQGGWPRVRALRKHIVKAHDGIADDAREDCALEDAWRAFRLVGLNPENF